MKNFIKRVLNNEMTGKDLAALTIIIFGGIILIGITLKAMGVPFASR